MKIFKVNEYDKLLSLTSSEDITQVHCLDHLNGFSAELTNEILDKILKLSQRQGHDVEFFTSYLFDQNIQNHYAGLKFNHVFFQKLRDFCDYRQHPERNHIEFLCSFNGAEHVSRTLLVSILHRFGWFDTKICSKNFAYSVDQLDGHLSDYLDDDRCRLYRPFFIGPDSAEFFASRHSFDYTQGNHAHNIRCLEHSLTSSFIHLVSESMSTSYYPYITEKFLYSVVTRGLFLVYAQPGWYTHLEHYYGFKPYHKIFDYRFDGIQNPVERLIELVSMIAKFSILSSDDWQDLYQMEIDTIEYNYDHYFSQRYIEHLREKTQCEI